MIYTLETNKSFKVQVKHTRDGRWTCPFDIFNINLMLNQIPRNNLFLLMCETYSMQDTFWLTQKGCLLMVGYNELIE